MAELNSWAHSVNGGYIDVNAWAGNQCWDLSQHRLTTCNDGTLWTKPSIYPDLTAGSCEVAVDNAADLLVHVTPIPAMGKGMPGDLPIWLTGHRTTRSVTPQSLSVTTPEPAQTAPKQFTSTA